jgi:hypothetical protein
MNLQLCPPAPIPWFFGSLAGRSPLQREKTARLSTPLAAYALCALPFALCIGLTDPPKHRLTETPVLAALCPFWPKPSQNHPPPPGKNVNFYQLLISFNKIVSENKKINAIDNVPFWCRAVERGYPWPQIHRNALRPPALRPMALPNEIFVSIRVNSWLKPLFPHDPT